MIVVDSSVWISRYRGVSSVSVRKLAAMLEGNTDEILVGDVVLLEVLQGARSDAHAAMIERGLGTFTIVSVLDAGLATAAAALYRRLRERGVTVRKTMDLVIASFCLERGHRLLHEDRDFDHIARETDLRIV